MIWFLSFDNWPIIKSYTVDSGDKIFYAAAV